VELGGEAELSADSPHKQNNLQGVEGRSGVGLYAILTMLFIAQTTIKMGRPSKVLTSAPVKIFRMQT